MSEVASRLKRVISYSEIKAIKSITKELDGAKEKIIINKDIADNLGLPRSMLVNALRMLEAAGVVETRSLGMKGTSIKVLDSEVLEEVIRF